MGALINLLVLLDFIALVICFVRYIKEETVKSIIGWIITSATMCILEIANIMIGGPLTVSYYTTLCIYTILFAMAVYAMIRRKNSNR